MNEAVPLLRPDASAAVAPALLAWYDRHRRVLPWRSPPGAPSDAYAVWLSEIMLQQTTVAAVKPYYAAFLAAWPTVTALAAAPLDDVLKAWAGLGYYSRARNLHACARAVVAAHGGRFPDTEAGLRALPGIGPYTAAAIAAIAHGRRAVVVDGNVERVMARLFAIGTSLPAARPQLRAAMDAVTPAARAGDFAQAVMDLGATICSPRRPACVLCPLMAACEARREGIMAELPRKAAKAAVPRRGGTIFVVSDPAGTLLVRQRPAQGLFGGMTEFPSTAWTESYRSEQRIELLPELAGFDALPVKVGRVEHGLTHFTLTLDVYSVVAKSQDIPGHRWATPDELDADALPTLMRKVLAAYRASMIDDVSRPPPPSRARDASRTHRTPRTGRHRTGP